MKDFLYRTIEEAKQVTDEDGDLITIRAWRTRNSNGHASIGLEFGNQRIEFSVSAEYEQHAKIAVQLLDSICDNPCTLPALPGDATKGKP